MYCKFKEGDLVMVKRDTKSYYGACVRKWVYGTVLLVHGDGYVSILLGKNNSILIPIKDLKKISDKKIPKGSCSSPRFNNGDHVLHTHNGKNRFLAIEGWVIDNKPYYNECKIVIRTLSGKHMIVNECDTRTIYEYRYFDTDMAYKQKLKEVSNMLNDGRIVQFKREGNTITATLYDTKEIGNGSKSHSPIVSESAKCHPDDRFDIDLGMDIAFKRLSAKWKLINKKSNLHRFLEGDVYVRVKKNDYCKFMCTLHDHDIWLANPVLFSTAASINDTLLFGVFGDSIQFMPEYCSYVKNVIDFEELLK